MPLRYFIALASCACVCCGDSITYPSPEGGCAESSAQCTCPSGLVLCASSCVDTRYDPGNCGSCGHVCATGDACLEGNCTSTSQCSAGFADCNNLSTDGCETSLNDDANNCGACGHVCANGNCSGGDCEKLVIANEQQNPAGIAVDETYVYWTVTSAAFSGVRRVQKGGGAVESLASSTGTPTFLALDATNIYWTDYTDWTVNSAPKSGGTRNTLVSEPGVAYVATDGAYVYFTANSGVQKVPVQGGAAEVLAAGTPEESQEGITIDDSTVYFAALGDVRKVSKRGGAVTTLAKIDSLTSGGVRALVQYDDRIFFVEYNTCRVWSVLKTGGTPALLGRPSSGACADIAVDASYVYIPNDLSRVPLGGGAFEMVAPGLGGYGIALDSSHIFATSATYILQVSK